jgi:hypothetical protein
MALTSTLKRFFEEQLPKNNAAQRIYSGKKRVEKQRNFKFITNGENKQMNNNFAYSKAI